MDRVIDHSNETDLFDEQKRHGFKTGLVPRNYTTHPSGYCAAAPKADIALIPQSEWSDRIKEMETTKTRVSDILDAQGIQILDQDGYGYCWAHSTVGAVQSVRAINFQPYVPLSAFAVAAIVKGYRDQGGWNTESLDFVKDVGVPAQSLWPQGKVQRSLDTQEMRANAALHKVTEWMDGSEDRSFNFKLAMTLALTRRPSAADFNWWGHSVQIVDAVEVEPGSFGIRIMHSWAGHRFEVLRGSHAIPDGISAPFVTGGSMT